jgi:hypothetical protein
MGTSVDASLALKISQDSAVGVGTVQSKVDKLYRTLLATGTAAGQADKVWQATRTIIASGNDDLDLSGAALTDAFGAALAFVKVKGLIVSAAAANANNLVVGNATSNGFISWVGAAAHTVTVRPGATLALIAGAADATGYACTAGTADILRISNGAGGTSVSYDVLIWGTSA